MTLKHNISGANSIGHAKIASLLMLVLAFQLSFTLSVRARGASVYTVAKVKIDARADNAVIAKEKALKQGPLRALNLMFKRLAPFRAYDRLPSFTPAEADEVIESFAIRNERNSSIRYIALLDYKFSRKKLQALLVKKGVPFYDGRSPKQVLMPVFNKTDGQGIDSKNQKDWWGAWRSIDFKHALTDTRLYKAKVSDQELWHKITLGDTQQYRALRQRYSAAQLILVDAQYNAQKDRLILHMFGEDHVGPIDYTQEIHLNSSDDKQNYETVAQIAFGILEGRWREPKIFGDVVAVVSASLDQDEAASSERLINETIFLRVSFRGLRDWQQIRKRLQRIPGIQKMQVNSLSPRGAEVRLTYPGGSPRLQTQLAAYQFALEQSGKSLVLRSVK